MDWLHMLEPGQQGIWHRTDGLILFGIILLRYFIVAGLLFHWLYASRQSPDSGLAPVASPRHDIHLSITTALIFAVAATLILTATRAEMTLLYVNPLKFGPFYLLVSYFAVLFLQDTYFYFTHRLFHHRRLFRLFHAGHHRSHPPTPWTSFAFDPPEAAVQALFLVAVVFVVPLHLITLLALLTTMTAWAVVNHLGTDHLPHSFPHHWLGRWFIGPAHHNLHHQHPNRHFGLYFTFWDWLLGTDDPRYGDQLHLRGVG